MSKQSPNDFQQERRKLNALVLVTYRVTQKLPDNEILKVRIQEAVLDILKLSELAYFKNKEDINKFEASIRTLINYFELTQAQNWMDKMNFVVLKKAFGQFLIEFDNNFSAISVKPFVAQVKNFSGPLKPNTRKVDLNPRQVKILEHLQKNKISEVVQLADLLPNISKRTIRRDLDVLIGQGLAIKKGKTNGAIYELA